MMLGAVTYNVLKDWNLETIIKNLEAAGYEAVELRTGHRHGVEPSISAADPSNGSVQVARNKTITLTFSEPIDPGTITSDNVTLSGPSGVLPSVLHVTNGDTRVTVTPVSTLRDQTRFTVKVKDITDRVGKTMVNPFTTSFTTVDITPPAVIDVTPLPAANGVTIYTTIRLKYSEPINPALFRGPPIVLSKAGVPLAGRTDYIFGNTVVNFGGQAEWIGTIVPVRITAANPNSLKGEAAAFIGERNTAPWPVVSTVCRSRA